SQRLHHRVVYDSHGKAEGGGEIETDPTDAQVIRLRTRPLIPDQSGITYGDGFIVPAFGQLLNYFHHFYRGQFLSGPALSRLCLSGSQDFDIRSADIDS